MAENVLSLNGKREFLRKMIEEGEELPTKSPWNIERIAKADRKTIHNLYAKITGEEMKPKLNKDVLSQMTGMKDFNQLLKDIHQNPLLSKALKFEVPTIMNPSDVIGSYIYERFQGILRPLAWFSTIFTHMDWSRFAAISQERQKIHHVFTESGGDCSILRYLKQQWSFTNARSGPSFR